MYLNNINSTNVYQLSKARGEVNQPSKAPKLAVIDNNAAISQAKYDFKLNHSSLYINNASSPRELKNLLANAKSMTSLERLEIYNSSITDPESVKDLITIIQNNPNLHYMGYETDSCKNMTQVYVSI